MNWGTLCDINKDRNTYHTHFECWMYLHKVYKCIHKSNVLQIHNNKIAAHDMKMLVLCDSHFMWVCEVQKLLFLFIIITENWLSASKWNKKAINNLPPQNVFFALIFWQINFLISNIYFFYRYLSMATTVSGGCVVVRTTGIYNNNNNGSTQKYRQQQ
jgi:hypothetical protein